MPPLEPGARVVLQNMNIEAYANHVAEIVAAPSFLEPRVAVRVCGTKKEVKVRPECCRPAQQPRTEDDLQGGQDARFITGVLTKASPGTFLPEVLHHVYRTLRMSNVVMGDVRVSSCSSEAVPHPLSNYTYQAQCTLEPGDKACWISRGGRVRPEWIVYCLGPSTRRVDYVLMSIPTMPHGPLSVRRFHLESSGSPDKDWESRTEHRYMTLDEEGLQEFAVIPPIEARYIRLVCTQNAAEDDASIAPSLTSRHGGSDPIGFWQIGFA